MAEENNKENLPAEEKKKDGGIPGLQEGIVPGITDDEIGRAHV